MNAGLARNEQAGWTVYAWLMYLPIFLIDPVSRTRAGVAPAWLWPITLLGLAVFLVSYFTGYWGKRRHLTRVAALQTALGVAFATVNAGAAVFFVYAASFAAFHTDGRRGLQMVITIALMGALSCLLTGASISQWVVAVGLALMIGGVNLHYAQVGRAQHKLRLAQEEVEHLATVAERERIGRDLHDVLGHTLSLIILKSELAAKLADRDPARAAREIRDVEAVARSALQDVREAIRGYRASLPEEIGRARALLKAADITARVEVADAALSRAQSETLAFALREAVTNVVRHARAQTCTIALREETGSAVLQIADDGRGGAGPEGGGLRGMRERIEALGGSVERSSTRGVQLTVRLPLATPETGNARAVAQDAGVA